MKKSESEDSNQKSMTKLKSQSVSTLSIPRTDIESSLNNTKNDSMFKDSENDETSTDINEEQQEERMEEEEKKEEEEENQNIKISLPRAYRTHNVQTNKLVNKPPHLNFTSVNEFNSINNKNNNASKSKIDNNNNNISNSDENPTTASEFEIESEFDMDEELSVAKQTSHLA
jgi:hypothetical protein